MSARLRDVAVLAGVSEATASLALNDKPVNEITRMKVLNAAQKLNYQPHSGGKYLATGRSNVIGMHIFGEQENIMEVAFYYPLMRGVMDVANRAGYAFQFGLDLMSADQQAALQSVLSRAADLEGMVVLPQWPSGQVIVNHLLLTGLHCVVINPVMTMSSGAQIMVDNHNGAVLAVRHLASLGYREIGLIMGVSEHIDNIRRVQGYYETMALLGLAVNTKYIDQGDYSIDGGYQAMKRILDRGGRPRAMFCLNDYMATGAMRAALESGLRIPDDMAFVGFDDTEVASAVYPRLTTVRQPCFDLGQRAGEILLGQMKKGSGEIILEILETELIIRESCGFRKP